MGYKLEEEQATLATFDTSVLNMDTIKYTLTDTPEGHKEMLSPGGHALTGIFCMDWDSLSSVSTTWTLRPYIAIAADSNLAQSAFSREASPITIGVYNNATQSSSLTIAIGTDATSNIPFRISTIFQLNLLTPPSDFLAHFLGWSLVKASGTRPTSGIIRIKADLYRIT